jgi:GDP/UDP-N,N'-diacetylbacillosamine 2-epimerase (hydrolysing)
MKRRILAILESRATYGYSRNVMRAMSDFSELELTTLVTGMHLVPELGNSIETIQADGFPISETVPMYASDSSPAAWPEALGKGIAGFARAFQRIKPDVVLIHGDRIESFGCCVAAAYMRLPVAHVQAGDKSGHIDDAARMAIGKLAHVHFASCEDSADRLRRMGEQEFRIFNVGAPQLDDITGRTFSEESLTLNGKTFGLTEPYILLVQHPVLAEVDEAHQQMAHTIDACLATKLPVVCIYPNSDSGFQNTLKAVTDRLENNRVILIPNIDRDHFLLLLANCAALVGNSSSGILEAPSFKIPVVNIGNRQRGRPQACNILNCSHDPEELTFAIHQALTDQEFRQSCLQAVNPYGDGKSGRRICEILQTIPIDKQLIDKETIY